MSGTNVLKILSITFISRVYCKFKFGFTHRGNSFSSDVFEERNY